MYVPKYFREDDEATLRQYVRDYGFGLLIVADADGIDASHVPFHLVDGPGKGALQCHVARQNPIWRRLADSPDVLVVFQGPDAYVTPSWYATKREHGKVVPTWNYLAVHIEGRARVVEDPVWIGQHLHDLTDQHETGRAVPWAVDDAPEAFTRRLMRGLIGIEIPIAKLTGKVKASQNQPPRNREGVKAGLEAATDTRSRELSRLIRPA